MADAALQFVPSLQDFVVVVGDAAVVVDRDDIRFVSQPLPPIKHFNK